MAGFMPLICTPTINNITESRTLIDGGAGLNVLSIAMFDQMQVPYERLMPTKPFTGVTVGTTTPIGQVSLLVTFGARSNYCTELIDFDVANLGLPYNTILGYPSLAKFMMVTHHMYNIVKLLGSGGTIVVRGDEKDAVRSLERAYKDAAAANPDEEDDVVPSAAPMKKKLFSEERMTTKQVSLGADGTGATIVIGGSLTCK